MSADVVFEPQPAGGGLSPCRWEASDEQGVSVHALPVVAAPAAPVT